MGSRLLAFLTLLVALLLPVAAVAADGSASPSPSPSASESASPAAEPITGTAINVVLSNDSELDAEGNAAPIPGVTLKVADDAGKPVGEGVTDADGRAIIEVPAKGAYTVTLDESTLPDDIQLDDDTATEVTVTARLDGPNNFGAFPIGVVAADTASFSDKFVSSLLSGIKFGLIIALAALGLSLIFGTTGLTNFSHGELITLRRHRDLRLQPRVRASR